MGNQQKIKQAAVIALAEDIQQMNAGDLEYLGHSLIQAIEGVSLIHRGLNRDGKPVGHTVDTFSADRTIVGEYSTEAGYFKEPFKKVLKDCRHAIKQAPDCKKLYLISNCLCRNTDWEGVKRAVKAELNENITYEIYDRDRLAGDIYDQAVIKNNLVEYFSDFLPSLWKLWTENAISHALPETPFDFVEDPERTKLIESALAENSVVVVYGISGTGKSYGAITYARFHWNEFRNVIWMSGKDLAGLSSLSAVTIERLGGCVNLSAKLCTSPCLFVVDDWKGDALQLLKLLPEKIHPETKVLVTSIDKPGVGVVAVDLPDVSHVCASKILLLGIDNPPTPGQVEEICRRVGKHPLTLAIIRDTVREDAVKWDAIVDDLPNIPNYEGSDHETILQRILLNHSQGVADELKILRWLGVVAIDALLAQKMLGIAGVPKLLRRSLLRKDGRGMCRIHDLVSACLIHFEGGNIADSEIEDRLKGFFLSEYKTGSYHFHRSLQIHADRIKEWNDVDNAVPSAEAYFFELSECILKPVSFSESLRKNSIVLFIQNREACLSIIEAIEQRYWNENCKVLKLEILDDGIANLSAGLCKVTDTDLENDLRHHRGKMLFWLNRAPDAIVDFEAVLDRDSNAFQSHLQLARIKGNNKDSGSAIHVEKILEAFTRDKESVAITIVLEAFRELVNFSNESIKDRWLGDPTLLMEAVSLAVAEGFSQTYRILGNLGRYLFYLHPDSVIQMAEQVSFPPPELAKSKECFAIAEFMKNLGKAMAQTSGDELEKNRWFEQAITYYDRLQGPNEYHITMKAECFILLDRFEEALQTLNEASEASHQCHWWHRRAQALLGLKREAEAFSAICTALSSNDNDRFTSAFLQVKARIEANMNLSDSLITLSGAIEKAGNDKFKSALEAELKALRNRFS